MLIRLFQRKALATWAFIYTCKRVYGGTCCHNATSTFLFGDKDIDIATMVKDRYITICYYRRNSDSES